MTMDYHITHTCTQHRSHSHQNSRKLYETHHCTVATVSTYSSSRHVSTCVPTPTYFCIWQSFLFPIQWLLCNTKFKKRLSKSFVREGGGGGRPGVGSSSEGGHKSFKRTFANIMGSFTITEKAPNSAFSWLKAPTSTLTFKTILRHHATVSRHEIGTETQKP